MPLPTLWRYMAQDRIQNVQDDLSTAKAAYRDLKADVLRGGSAEAIAARVQALPDDPTA